MFIYSLIYAEFRREGRNIPLRIRDSIIVSSYEADAIVTAIEIKADA